MKSCWIPLQSIPAEGQTLVYDDQTLWQEALKDLGISCGFRGPVKAEVFVLPQEEGALLRGDFSASVILPCDRCSEDSMAEIAEHFDSFEPYPAEPAAPLSRRARLERPAVSEEPEDIDVDAEVMRLAAQGRGVEINPFALALEEFVLALPAHLLCSEGCKGLCPVCGCNKNEQQCACAAQAEDPRLAPLKKLSFGKK